MPFGLAHKVLALALLGVVAADFESRRAERLKKMQAKMPQQPPQPEEMQEQQMQVDTAKQSFETMRETDKNKDNVLDRAEIALWVEKNMKMTRKAIKMQNKKVREYRPWDVQEVPKLKVGEEFEELVDETFEKMDKDGSGLVNFTELSDGFEEAALEMQKEMEKHKAGQQKQLPASIPRKALPSGMADIIAKHSPGMVKNEL